MKCSLAADDWRALFLLSLQATLISIGLTVLAFLSLHVLFTSLEFAGRTEITDGITPALLSSKCLSV